MDYYSQFPAPPLDECKNQIKQIFCFKYGKDSNYVDNLISDAFIHANILDENNEVKYSLPGWNVFGKKDVVKSLEILNIQRKEKIRRKIIGVLKCSYLLLSLYKKTLERLYHPNSDYVNEILKSNFEKNANNK